jgi:hypothetical protein
VEVTNVPPAVLESVRSASMTADDWHRLLKVTVGPVASESLPSVEGRYAATGSTITFIPLFPFDPGREYIVAFDPSRVPGASFNSVPPLARVVGLPGVTHVPSTKVTAVYPSADVLPENTLRMYVEFSAPMGNVGSANLVKVLDEQGREVDIPFLPVDAAFWNADHTRYTLFFDPGRVKQGILPNRELGRPLRAGRRYTLEISADWRDGHGQPLVSPYRRTFRVGPSDMRPLSLSSWRIAPPAGGTRDALVVTFPGPLDHGLAARAIGVEGQGGRAVDGVVSLESADTRWMFRPASVWAAGKYQLVALSILEDPAGNQIGRAFEVDMTRPAADAAPDAYRLEFQVAGPGS